MTEAINLQVNVLQGQEMVRQPQAKNDVMNNQQMGQEINRAKEAQAEPETVQTSPDAQNAKLSKDGNSRGRAFLRQRKKQETESAPEIERAADPGKGTNVDFVR